jgi:precorrin-4 methylase
MKEFFQFSINEDWYTISRDQDDENYEVSHQGSGDYETYKATKEEVKRLKSFATSEII